MTRDPIVEDVRSTRQKIFEASNEDLDALLDRFQDQEEVDRDRLVSDLSTQPQRDTKRLRTVHPE